MAKTVLKKGTNDLETVFPSLAKEWHPTKNGSVTPSDVTAKSKRKVWWLGECGHEWETGCNNRAAGSGCPVCANKITVFGENDISTTNPDLAAEWHPTKNEFLMLSKITTGSSKKVWWLGKCGHEWPAVVAMRVRGFGCPYCAGRLAIPGETDLATTRPDLAEEWHPTKNGDLLPTQVMRGTAKKVWWLGKCGHEWQASPNNRRGCPICMKQQRKIKKGS